jgi:hypothetical protein
MLEDKILTMRHIIQRAYCGGPEKVPLGIRHSLDAVREHLFSYLTAIDEDYVGTNDVNKDMPKDKRLEGLGLIVKNCKKHVLYTCPEEGLIHSSKDLTRVAHLRIIPEKFEVIEFFVNRLAEGACNLISEIAEEPDPEKRKDIALSPFAQVEMKDFCQRLHTITMFTHYVICEKQQDAALHKEVAQISSQLADFVKICMNRHTTRFLQGQCRLNHDAPYCGILDSGVNIASKLAEIADDWVASKGGQ